MKISIIAALGEDNSLGKGGDLCWKISEDLNYFKSITRGEVVIMGRKTWESLPIKPLPDRRNIVLTRQKNYEAPGAEVYDFLTGALDALEKEGIEKVFIIGGGEVYKKALPKASTLHLTRIYEKCPEADTFFPEFIGKDWNLFTYSNLKEEKGIKYRYQTWIKYGNTN